jgi:hypothetical protein
LSFLIRIQRFPPPLAIPFEVHPSNATATDEAKQERHTTKYVDVDTSELWETLPKFSDNRKIFTEFIAAVYTLYPGADEESKWSVADMDKLVGECTYLGIIFLGDLGEYYCQFLAITTFLHSKIHLSAAKHCHTFIRGFTSEFWHIISQSIKLKNPDHFPNDPYDLSDIHKAACYILHGTPSVVPTTSTSLPVPATQSAVERPKIKMEDVTTLLECINNTMPKLLMAQVTLQRPPLPKNMNSYFCSLLDHLGQNCMVAVDYITQGKCR